MRPDQRVNPPGLLHLNHVTGAVDYLDPSAGGGFRMTRRNDTVLSSPDDQGRTATGVEAGALRPAGEDARGKRAQRLGHAVDPLVFEEVVDELARDERGIGEELFDYGLKVAPRRSVHEAIDVIDVDVGPEPRGRDKGQRLRAVGGFACDLDRNRAAEGMPDEMRG